jgi:serine/arginine repetitive matrix protein 2
MPDAPTMMPDAPTMLPEPIPGPLKRSRLQPSSRRGLSSYWSVTEQTDFLRHFAQFGTDYAAIATHMGTKTEKMVKNHYQRSVEEGKITVRVQIVRNSGAFR